MDNITIAIPDSNALKTATEGLVDGAKAVQITSRQTRQEAADFERELLRREKVIVEHYKPIKQSVDAHKRVILDQEREFLAPIQEAKKILKDKELAWDNEQNRIAEKEAKRIEAEVKRQAEDVRIARAEELQKLGQKEAADAVLSAPVVVAPIKPVFEKTTGQSIREAWTAEVVDLPSLIAFVAANPSYGNLLQPDLKELKGLARSMKEKFSIPGARAWSEKSLVTKY